MNECHDHASWGKGDPETDFNRYVERFILFINERVPDYKGLFFVEGIFLNAYGKAPSQYPYWVRTRLPACLPAGRGGVATSTPTHTHTSHARNPISPLSYD